MVCGAGAGLAALSGIAGVLAAELPVEGTGACCACAAAFPAAEKIPVSIAANRAMKDEQRIDKTNLSVIVTSLFFASIPRPKGRGTCSAQSMVGRSRPLSYREEIQCSCDLEGSNLGSAAKPGRP